LQSRAVGLRHGAQLLDRPFVFRLLDLDVSGQPGLKPLELLEFIDGHADLVIIQGRHGEELCAHGHELSWLNQHLRDIPRDRRVNGRVSQPAAGIPDPGHGVLDGALRRRDGGFR
jgi:hypothetical protein